MIKYRLKKNLVGDFHREYNMSVFAKKIGITRQTLSNIVNKGCKCSYPVAYTITKTISQYAEVDTFFEEI